MAAAATGFSAFFGKFNEMSKTMELQRDAFNCMQTMKSGIPIGSGSALQFQGIATADSVVFQGTSGTQSDAIILYPPVSDYTHQNDFIRIFWDGKYVRATYLNGSIQPASPLYLFPKPTRGNKMEVTRLRFSKVNSDATAKVVLVEMDAQVEILKNAPPRYVSYTTRMTLTMK
jgi:hypothetical protein